MCYKVIDINRGKIFKVILFLLLLFALFFAFLPKARLRAETENKSMDLIISSVINHINILRDGRVEGVLQFDVKATGAVDVLNIPLTHQADQSITVNDVQLAEINASGPTLDYIKAVQVNELDKNQINSYTVSDLGNRINVRLNKTLPQATGKRVRISYMVNSASIRFNDASLTELTLFSEEHEEMIRGYALIVSFDSVIFLEEINKFNLFERNSVEGMDKMLRPVFMSEVLNILKLDSSEILNVPSNAYVSFASFIPENIRVDIRLLYPSDWLTKTRITLTDDPNTSAYEQIRSEENAYVWRQIQKSRYQVVSRYVVIILFVLAMVYFSYRVIRNTIDRYKDTPYIRFSIQDQISAAGLAFLERKKVDSYTIWAILYTLISKDFLTVNNERLRRQEEQLLPDEKKLQYYERVVLHWVWNLMEGKNSILIEDLSVMIEKDLDNNMEKLTRLQKALELHCIENNFLLVQRTLVLRKSLLVFAIIYILVAILLSIIASFFWSMCLLIPSAIFFALSFEKKRYTDLGYKLIVESSSYKKYLRNVDRYHEGEYSRDKFIEDFIYSIALQCNEKYLQSLKYALPMRTAVKNRYFTSMGFNEVEIKVYKELVKEENDLSIKRQKEIYRRVLELVEQRILDTQHSLNKLELHRIFPKKVEIAL